MASQSIIMLYNVNAINKRNRAWHAERQKIALIAHELLAGNLGRPGPGSGNYTHEETNPLVRSWWTHDRLCWSRYAKSIAWPDEEKTRSMLGVSSATFQSLGELVSPWIARARRYSEGFFLQKFSQRVLGEGLGEIPEKRGRPYTQQPLDRLFNYLMMLRSPGSYTAKLMEFAYSDSTISRDMVHLTWALEQCLMAEFGCWPSSMELDTLHQRMPTVFKDYLWDELNLSNVTAVLAMDGAVVPISENPGVFV